MSLQLLFQLRVHIRRFKLRLELLYGLAKVLNLSVESFLPQQTDDVMALVVFQAVRGVIKNQHTVLIANPAKHTSESIFTKKIQGDGELTRVGCCAIHWQERGRFSKQVVRESP